MITAIDTNILLDILLPNEKSYEAWIAPCKVRRQRFARGLPLGVRRTPP